MRRVANILQVLTMAFFGAIMLILIFGSPVQAVVVGDIDFAKIGKYILSIDIEDGNKLVFYPYDGDLKIIRTEGYLCMRNHYHATELAYIKDGKLRVFRGSGTNHIYTEFISLSKAEVKKKTDEINAYIKKSSSYPTGGGNRTPA